MNYPIKTLVLICTLCTTYLHTAGQVSNDNINFHLYFSNFNYPDNQDDDIFTEENIRRILRNGVVVEQGTFYEDSPFTSQWQVEVEDHNNSNFVSAQYWIDAWEHDTDPRYVFNAPGDDTPCGIGPIQPVITPRSMAPMQQHFAHASCPNGAQQSATIYYTYRYTNGDNQSQPLDLGAVTPNSPKTHVNRINYWGSYNGQNVSANLDYTDSYSDAPFQSGVPEIFYRFRIDACQRVEIKELYNSIADLKMGLYHYNTSSQEVEAMIATDSDSPHEIDLYLESGHYAIILESNDNEPVLLSVEAFSYSPPQAGTLSYSGFDTTYVGYDPPGITSLVAPSGDYTNIQWFYTVGNEETEIPMATSHTYDPPGTMVISGQNIFTRKVFNDVCGSSDEVDQSIVAYPKNGNVSGSVVVATGNCSGDCPPFPNATVTLTNTESIIGLGGPNTTTLTTTTDAQGNYQFTNFYVGPYWTNWNVTPSVDGHGFEPATQNWNLQFENPSHAFAPFMDTTSFTFTGVVKDTNGCGIPGVDIYFESEDGTPGLPVQTDDSGSYTLIIPYTGTWDIEPSSDGLVFDPSLITTYIAEPSEGNDFDMVTSHSLAVVLRGGCDQFIGTATIDILDTLNCHSTQVATGAGVNDTTTLSLPARPYDLIVTGFSPAAGADPDIFSEDNIIQYFSSQTLQVDLTESDTSLQLVYHPEPSLSLSNWPEPPCPDIDYPVLQIHTLHPVTLEPWDIPPGALEGYPGGCPLDTGHIIVSNHVASYTNNPIIDTIPIDQTNIAYFLKGGVPNLVSPFTKSIEFNVVDTSGNNASIVRNIIVEGNRPRETMQSTVSPQIPLYILRDPPGDLSFSTVTENETLTTTSTISTSTSNSVNTFARAVVDYEITDNTKVWGNIEGKFNYESTATSAYSRSNTSSVITTYNTSSDPVREGIGESADVYVGAAFNLLYSISDIVRLDTNRCEIVRTEDITIDPDSFATTFIHSNHYIKNTLIPNLRDVLLPNASNPDSIRYFENQIRIWEATMRRNEELKADAEYFTNFTFDGNIGEIVQEYEIASAYSTSYEWSSTFDESFYVDMGAIFHGFGAEGGREYIHQWTNSGAIEGEVQESLTVSYTIDDDDVDDNFFVHVLKDKYYPTHVFKTISGASTCPPEPGTQKRHDATLTANTYTQYNVPADEEAEYILTLSNISQSGDTMAYFLDFNGTSNQDNAEVSLDIQSESVLHLAPFESANFSVDIGRNISSNIYAYEGLEFRVFSGCLSGGTYQPDEARPLATIKLNTYFQAPCSEITINTPEEGWIASQASDEALDIHLTDYDLENLNTLTIQYASVGSAFWSTAMNVPVSSMNNDPATGTVVSWDASEIPDGKYKIRAKVTCTDVINYTTPVSGIIDNTSPRSFGYPFPEDHVYTVANFIGLDLNERISSNTGPGNIRLWNALTNIEYDTDIYVDGNRLYVNPLVDLHALPAASYNIEFINVQDQYGNPIEDTVSWWFTVGNYSPFFCDENTVYYVDNSLNRAYTRQNGSSWEDAFVDLRDALETACPGSSIYVAEGTYYPTDSAWMEDPLVGDNSAFLWSHSYHIYGGFPSGGSDFLDRNPDLYRTILSGDANKNGIPDAGDCHTILKIHGRVADARMEGITFEGVYADGSAVIDRTGAIYNDGAPIIANCVFRNNHCPSSGTPYVGVGGGVYSFDGHPTFVNCLFHDNTTTGNGAGLCSDYGAVEVINCTFTQNSSPVGSAVNAFNATVTIDNSIFFDNSGDDFELAGSTPNITVSNSSFEEDTLEITSGNNNLWSTDPLFADPVTDDFQLQSASPCIDQGAAAIVLALGDKDLAFRLRAMDNEFSPNPQCDLGAYENGPCSGISGQTILYVDSASVPGQDGLTWATAINTVAKAIMKAQMCSVDTILVAAGTYFPMISDSSSPRESAFNIPDGMVIMGGYPSGGGPRDPAVHTSLLSGDIGINGLETDNSFHVVTLDNPRQGTVVDGFTIAHGNADHPSMTEFQSGGGVYILASGGGFRSQAAIANCTIKDCSAQFGGGIYISALNQAIVEPVITGCTIISNLADKDGGGLYINAKEGSTVVQPAISNSFIQFNTAKHDGGAVFVLPQNGSYCFPYISDSVISQNQSDADQDNVGIGGGLQMIKQGTGKATLTLNGVTFDGNTTGTESDAIYINPDLKLILRGANSINK